MISVWWLPILYSIFAVIFFLMTGKNKWSAWGYREWVPSGWGMIVACTIVPMWMIFFALMYFFKG